MELAYWEGDQQLGKRRQHEYNCTWCQRKGWDVKPGKQCLRRMDTCIIPAADVTERGFKLSATRPTWEASPDQILTEIHRLHIAQPDRTPMQVSRILRVCPTGLLDVDDWQMLALEGAVREYGAAYFKAHGFNPVPATVLDCLQVIRSTRNELEALRFKKVTKNG